MEENQQQLVELGLPLELPAILIASTVIFPLSVSNVQLRTRRNLNLLKAEKRADQLVALVYFIDGDLEEARPENISSVGVEARVLNRLNLPEGSVSVALQGLRRVAVEEFTQQEPYFRVSVSSLAEEDEDSLRVNSLIGQSLELFEKLVSLSDHFSNELLNVLKTNVSSPFHFVDLLATYANFRYEDKLRVLSARNIQERLEIAIAGLISMVESTKVQADIKRQVQVNIEKSQREYYLRQQLMAIKKELGEEDAQEADVKRLKERINSQALPSQVQEEALNEVNRLSLIPLVSAEYNVSRTYLDWLLTLPWQNRLPDVLDLEKVRQALDEEHYALDKVKERIIEYLAVLKLKEDLKGPILCFAGPPGVGKTSLGLSIARAMGRRFVHFSVGGMRDEAEIRGHRRTYVGALPGKIIQSLKKAGCNNPLMMIDEIDKMGKDFQGDPAAALLEVLDPEQNYAFVDHYLGIPFDLSKVMFIGTANILYHIPAPLLDRMEVIEISGYTPEEKLIIAKKHILPKIIRSHGLGEGVLDFTDDALNKIIRQYTEEAGLRNLERELATVARKVAKDLALGKVFTYLIGEEEVEEFLGPPKVIPERAEEHSEVGVATGLAWTVTGGDLLLIEALKMKGSGNLTVTGQLGEVMQESVQAAFSFVRSRAETLGINPKAFKESDIHVHFPAGAIPKDGPSAGVTAALAIASLFSGQRVRNDLAMTGEITLRGKILAVGGIKEKVLAAYRSGIKKVILPKENLKDLIDVPKEIKEKMEFASVERVDEVLALALVPLGRRKSRGRTRPEGSSRRIYPAQASKRRKK